jgi:hypothetical protein
MAQWDRSAGAKGETKTKIKISGRLLYAKAAEDRHEADAEGTPPDRTTLYTPRLG